MVRRCGGDESAEGGTAGCVGKGKRNPGEGFDEATEVRNRDTGERHQVGYRQGKEPGEMHTVRGGSRIGARAPSRRSWHLAGRRNVPKRSSSHRSVSGSAGLSGV